MLLLLYEMYDEGLMEGIRTAEEAEAILTLAWFLNSLLRFVILNMEFAFLGFLNNIVLVNCVLRVFKFVLR